MSNSDIRRKCDTCAEGVSKPMLVVLSKTSILRLASRRESSKRVFILLVNFVFIEGCNLTAQITSWLGRHVKPNLAGVFGGGDGKIVDYSEELLEVYI